MVAGRSDRLKLVREDLAEVSPPNSDLALDGIRRFNVGTFCMLFNLELGKFLKVISTQNRCGLNDMTRSNKWEIDVSNRTFDGDGTMPDVRPLSGYNKRAMDLPIEVNEIRLVPSVSMDDARSDTLLLSSLRDQGFDDIDMGDVKRCPPSLISVIWKLLSERYTDLRSAEYERGNMARIQHDNKVLAAKISKLSMTNERLLNRIKELESSQLKKESELRSRMEMIEQNRSEWERCAIAFKSRESKFVAEIRKQESQYAQLQTRISSRNRSVGPAGSFRHSHRLEFN